eukprot:UN02040
MAELKKFISSYQANNDHYQFNAILYNMPQKNFNTKQYMRPNTVSQHLWEQANKQNPDPDHLTPVFIKGAEQLKREQNFWRNVQKMFE